MSMRRQDLITIVSVTFLFAFIGFILVTGTGVIFAKKQLNNKIDNMLVAVDSLISEASSVLNHLDNTKNIVCEEEYLLFLRQVMFQGRYIKDIGYYEDNMVICTTSMGILEQPITTEEVGIPFNNNQEILIESPLMLFDLDYAAFRMKNQRFFAVTEFREIISEEIKNNIWELVFIHHNKIINVLGEEGLYNNYSKSKKNKPILTNIITEKCLPTLPFCVLFSKRIVDYVDAKIIVFLSLVIVFFALLGYLLISKIVTTRNSIEQRVIRGLKNKAFYPLFQPIVDLKTNKIYGCEVLARFKDNQGPLFPDQFIPLLPKLQLTLPFTTKLIEMAIMQLSENSAIPKGFKINLNIYPSDITKSNVSEFMYSAKNDKDFNICFEITEDATFNTPEALENISRLRRCGFQVAIDDFGTGYANLGQLQNIEFDFLKIDRSFIMALEGDNFKSTLIPTIVALSEQLSVTLVAEGIETEQQASILRNLNTGLGQGWLFGKPMSATLLGELVKENAR